MGFPYNVGSQPVSAPAGDGNHLVSAGEVGKIVDKVAYKLHTRFKSKAAKYLALAKKGTTGAYEQARSFQMESNKWYMTAIGLGRLETVAAPNPKPTKKKKSRRSGVPSRRSVRIINSTNNSDEGDGASDSSFRSVRATNPTNNSDEGDGASESSFQTVQSGNYSDNEFESYGSQVENRQQRSEEPVFDVHEPSSWLPSCTTVTTNTIV